MFKFLAVTSIIFSAFVAQASSKCVLIKVQGDQRTRQEIQISQENMRIEENVGKLEATIQIIHGRLVNMAIFDNGNFTRAALPMEKMAEEGTGALSLEDMKGQTAIEMTCKI